MEPKPIEPQDIRVGDRVRATLSHDGTVTGVDDDLVYIDRWGHLLDAYTIELLERPEPERPVGSHWRDPETGAEYVQSDSGYTTLRRYRQGSTKSEELLAAGYNDLDTEIIARLTSVPAFDPATLWPCAPDGARRCKESDAAGLTCTRYAEHDGLHAAHGLDTTQPLAVWGDPR